MSSLHKAVILLGGQWKISNYLNTKDKI